MKLIKNTRLAAIISAAMLAITPSVWAAVTQFNLQGTAGPGLLFGNEPAVASGGSGGEIGAGISFDDATSLLTINAGWGSSQGFTDLSSLANNSHIHVTPANFGNDGTGNFKQTGGVVVSLARSSSAVTGGTFTTAPILLTAGQITDLFNGKFYINLHTVNNGGGEIRGFLVPAAPHLVSAASLDATSVGAGRWNVGVAFDTTLDKVSAETPGNYSLDGGGNVLTATLRSDSKSVVLGMSGEVPASFTVTVTGVKDSALNLIAPGSSVNGVDSGYRIKPVGTVNAVGNGSSAGPGDLEVSAGGNDIWGATDSFTWVYKDRTGDFDVQVKLADVKLPSNRNGIMMRTSDNDNAMCAYSTLYGGQLPGQMLYGFHGRTTDGGSMGTWYNPIPGGNWETIPGTPPRWLRLKRLGPTFYSFRSTDGANWAANGLLSLPNMPATAQLGIAQNNGNQPTLGVTHYTGIADFSWPQGRVVVTQPPTNTTVLQNRPYNLSVAGTAYRDASTNEIANGEITYQWQRNGVNIPGAINSTYSVTYADIGDNGVPFRCVLTISGASTNSTDAFLTVNADTAKPVLLSAGSLNTTVIDVVFDEDLDKTSAETTSHYTVTGGTVGSATLQADKRTVKLAISGLAGSSFSVTTLGVQDLAGNASLSANKAGIIQGLDATEVGVAPSSVIVPTPNEFDVVAGGDDIWGKASTFYYLNKPQSGDFDYVVQVYKEGPSQANSLIFRQGLTKQESGAQVRSYGFELPGSATILFGVALGDGQFNWPPGYSDWTRTRDGTMNPPNQYLRLKRIGNTFWGFISSNSVSWRNIGSDQAFIEDPGYIGLGTANSAQGTIYKNLAPFTYPSVSIQITVPPASQTNQATLPVTFTVAATASSAGNPLSPVELTYQWQLNNVNIEGATGTNYTIPAVLIANNNSNYRCVVSVSGGSLASPQATLTVLPKTSPPLVVSASGVQPGQIGIQFDSFLDEASATNKNNYSLSGGTVTGVYWSPDGYSVVLSVSGLAGNSFDVLITNVKDGGGNAVPPNTHAIGTLSAVSVANIGVPEVAGHTLSAQSGKYALFAGGSSRNNGALDATGTGTPGDNLHFVYQEVTGDFDKIVNLTALSTSKPTARAGIMARSSVTTNVCQLVELTADGDAVGENHRIVMLTKPNPPGADVPGDVPSNYYSQLGVGAMKANLLAGGGTGQWLRIRRTGQDFHYFVKSGTNDWGQICSKHSPDMPKQMYVGFYLAVNNFDAASPDVPEGGSASFEGWGDYVKSGDATAPVLVSAGTKDKKVIGVKFSEDINGTSINPANFVVTQSVGGAVTVTGADTAMMGDGVYLTVTGLTSDTFTVKASGVTDLAGNVMAANSTVNASVSGLKSFDLGVFVNPAVRPQVTDDPYIVGSSIVLSSGNLLDIDIIGGGYNNGVGTPDASHVPYKEVSGDFDIMCAVIRYDKTDRLDGWANGGLTVFAGTNSTAKTDGTPIEPNTDDAASIVRFTSMSYCQNALNASKFFTTGRDNPASGQWADGPQIQRNTPDGNGRIGRWSRYLNVANASGVLVANYDPSVEEWHRLKRVGTTVSDYWSVDGATWMFGYTRNMPRIPANCLVGFQFATDASGGHKGQNASGYVAVGIRNFGTTAAIGTQPTLTVGLVGGNIVISWPTGTGYGLQATTSLSSPAWQTPSGLQPVVVGSDWVVTIPPGAGARFFRLIGQ